MLVPRSCSPTERTRKAVKAARGPRSSCGRWVNVNAATAPAASAIAPTNSTTRVWRCATGGRTGWACCSTGGSSLGCEAAAGEGDWAAGSGAGPGARGRLDDGQRRGAGDAVAPERLGAVEREIGVVNQLLDRLDLGEGRDADRERDVHLARVPGQLEGRRRDCDADPLRDRERVLV